MFTIDLQRGLTNSGMDEYASGEVNEGKEIVRTMWERLRETHKLRVVE